MQGDEDVAPGLQLEVSPGRQVARAALEPPERVDHRVPDLVDPLGRGALGQEVGPSLGAVREEEVCESVGENAVDLLGHRPVARAQAGLDVRDGDLELRRRQRAGQGGVHVAAHDHEVRLLLEEHPLDLDERAPGLLGMAAGTDPEVTVGRREAEIGEHRVRERGIVVLSRMHDELPQARALRKRVDDREHLHVVGTRPDHVDDGRHAASSKSSR